MDIMRINVERIVERGQNLNDVDERADALAQSASQFQEKSGSLQRKHWLANMKMRIAIGVIGIVLIVAIVCRDNCYCSLFNINHLFFSFSVDCIWMIRIKNIHGIHV